MNGNTPSNSQPVHPNQQVTHQEMRIFSGPFPEPAMLQEYESIFPGAAERIFALTESQSKHRQKIESRVIWSNIVDSKLGLILGSTIALSIIYGGVKIILAGFEIAGYASIVTAVVGVAASYWRASTSQKNELQRKDQQSKKINSG